MPRPSKATHVLAKLRGELGLHQKELAERVGLHWRTIQDIERGKLQLSRRNAIKIGEKFGVSPAWLLQNDASQEIENVSGERWSLKNRRTMDAHYPGLARELPLVRQLLLAGICSRLLSQYLRFRAYFDGLPDAMKILNYWLERQERAWSEFVASHKELADRTQNVPAVQTLIDQNTLGSIRDDIDAISGILWAIETQYEPWETILTREKIESVLPWEKVKEIARLDKLGQPLPPELNNDLFKAAKLLVQEQAAKLRQAR